MKYIHRLSLVITVLILLYSTVILPSFSLELADLYNEKRIAEAVVLLFGSVSFLYLLSTRQLNISKKAVFSFGVLFILLACSVFISTYPGWALLEIGWYFCLLQLTIVLAHLYQEYPKKFEQIMLAAIIGMAAIYSIRVAGDLITGWLDKGWPAWPNHRRMVLMMNGENIAKNGFLNFQNVRFFNHLQTWSLPLLVYSYLRYSNFLTQGFKILLAGLISFWWMLVFASGARGTMLATILSVIIVYILFRKESLSWIKPYAYTFITGLLLYFIIFHLILTGGAGQEITRSDSSGRLSLWWASWQAIKQNFFLGLGPMQMANVQGTNPITSPHNIYLMWAAEWGIPAFLLSTFIGLKGLLIWIKESLRNTSDKKIAISAALVAGIIHSGVSGLMITPLSQLLFVALLGWAIGIYYSEKEQSLFIEKGYRKPVKYALLTSFLCINLYVFISVGTHIPNLEVNRERFQQLHRQGSLKLYPTSYATIFPRFWDQGFIGIEDYSTDHPE